MPALAQFDLMCYRLQRMGRRRTRSLGRSQKRRSLWTRVSRLGCMVGGSASCGMLQKLKEALSPRTSAGLCTVLPWLLAFQRSVPCAAVPGLMQDELWQECQSSLPGKEGVCSVILTHEGLIAEPSTKLPNFPIQCPTPHCLMRDHAIYSGEEQIKLRDETILLSEDFGQVFLSSRRSLFSNEARVIGPESFTWRQKHIMTTFGLLL